MDSDDSHPGSSDSNTSSNSSENSHHSDPIRTNDEESTKSRIFESPKNNVDKSSRSGFSNDVIGSPRSVSKSDSDSSSTGSTSENEQDDTKPLSTVTLRKRSTDRSSGEDSRHKHETPDLRNQSESPKKSGPSSRNSSSSSNRSRSNSRNNQGTDDNTNISHGLSDVSDMESDKNAFNSKQSAEDNVNISSDPTNGALEDKIADDQNRRRSSLGFDKSQDTIITDLRQKLDKKKTTFKTKERDQDIAELSGIRMLIDTGKSGESLEDLAHDEDALDFEAEEGECQEISSKDEDKTSTGMNEEGLKEITKYKPDKSEGEAEEGEELEEGEVSDEDEKRPEETEPKPVCRFYTRGQCTWGMSCRFLHPGVTDKGNYTMFDLVRPVSVPQTGTSGSRTSGYAAHSTEYHDYRTERPVLHRGTHHPLPIYPVHHDSRAVIAEGPVVVESAWERGLRTAKEMMRKANKRKEQDMDFEDKKMNLTLSPDELEKEPYFLKDRGSPDNATHATPYGRYGHGIYQEVTSGIHSPSDRFGRNSGPAIPYEEIDTYGRTTRYRELPPHRMPQYEDERRVRPTREVIVQRVEPVGRGDEWKDPWMRSKSPGGRGSPRDRGDKRRRDRHSYSSNSSYSSSSSSQSDSSSDSSHSPSPVDHKKRYKSGSHKSTLPNRRQGVSSVRSPTSPSRRSKRSPNLRHSPTAKRRGHISSSPVLDKRTTYSPVHKRGKVSPILKKSINNLSKTRRRHTSSSSGSGSSDSSGSDSESGSSSSESSSQCRDRKSLKRKSLSEKAMNTRRSSKIEAPKKRSPISIEIKKQATVGASALTSSPTHSISSEKDSKKSRREELLKQLRAVEDAIAKKRSKLA